MKSKLKAMILVSLLTYVSLIFSSFLLFSFLEIILPTGNFDELLYFIKMFSIVFIIPSIGNGIWFVVRNYNGW